MRAPTPTHEHDRLQALHDLRALDIPADQRFDDIARSAADLFGATTAVIALVDHDRVWPKAHVGIGAGQHALVAPLSALTIAGDGVVVVPDASADERLAGDAVEADGTIVRFAAGAPLATVDGHSIGALVVLGAELRAVEPWQQRMLQLLAQQAMAEMRIDALRDDYEGALDDLDMARRNLSFLATHDPLTGLKNRQALDTTLQGLVSANRAGTVTSAVLVVDLDNFKDVNDSLGREAGDRVLVSIGDRIHLGARGDDTVARLASDQFVVVIPDAGSIGAESLARRLLQTIAAPVDHHGASIAVTASIGIARWGTEVTSVDEVMRSAEAALHEAKREGRNRYVTFEDRVADELARRLDAHTFVRQVVRAQAMRLDVQPLWSLSSGKVVAHEVMLRWDAPLGPRIEPSEFVAAAEAIGLIGEITRFTISEGCRLAARRRAAGEHDAAVTVKLSSLQLERDEVILVVATALNESGLEPSGLILEITESATLARSGSAQATLRELQHMGVRIALDDVGIGFASLALLRSFPFDFMKIDRSFVTVAADADRDVLRSLVQLGHSLGMRVVTEGAGELAALEHLRGVSGDIHPLIATLSRFA